MSSVDRAGYIVKLLAALKQINSDRQEKQNNTPNNDLIQPAGGNRISNNSGKTVDDPGGEKPIDVYKRQVLSKKKGKCAWIVPSVEEDHCTFTVHQGAKLPEIETPKQSRGAAFV